MIGESFKNPVAETSKTPQATEAQRSKKKGEDPGQVKSREVSTSELVQHDSASEDYQGTYSAEKRALGKRV